MLLNRQKKGEKNATHIKVYKNGEGWGVEHTCCPFDKICLKRFFCVHIFDIS
jgi:hypothetical protein